MKRWKILGVVMALGLVVAASAWWSQRRSDAPSDAAITTTVAKTSDERLSKGKQGAPVQMVEYIDMFCSSCARAHAEVMPKIEAEYIATDKLHYEARVVAKTHHKDAQKAANGAYCAAEQGKFWRYIDLVYSQSARHYQAGAQPADITIFSGSSVRELVREVGVNVPVWENCVKQASYNDTIKKHEQDMSKLNAYGTPHSVINGKNYNGAPPYRTFKTVIDAALDTTKKQPKKEKS